MRHRPGRAPRVRGRAPLNPQAISASQSGAGGIVSSLRAIEVGQDVPLFVGQKGEQQDAHRQNGAVQHGVLVWIKIVQAASGCAFSPGRSTSFPLMNVAPARTRATRWGRSRRASAELPLSPWSIGPSVARSQAEARRCSLCVAIREPHRRSRGYGGQRSSAEPASPATPRRRSRPGGTGSAARRSPAR